MEIDELIKQREYVNSLAKLRKISNKIIEILNTVYGDNVLRKTTMFKLIKRFNEGSEGCKNNVKLEHPFTSGDDKNIELMRFHVFSDWRMIVQMVEYELNIEISSIHTVLTQKL